jgi:hypothetical protein
VPIILFVLLVVLAIAAVAAIYLFVIRRASRTRTRACPQCGAQVREGFRNCHKCGYDFFTESPGSAGD